MPLTALLTGLGLAAAAGFNAWAVLLLFHGLYRLLPQEFPSSAAALLGSQTVFGFALVLFLAEFVITKIPLLDRFWELAHTLLRPIVGAFLAIACVPETSLFPRIGIGLAGAIATLASGVSTRDPLAYVVVAVVLATLVFFVPWVTALLLAALSVLLLTHLPRVKRALGVLFFRLQHPRRRTPAGA